MIANANRDAKKRPRPFAPDDFNPMARKDRKKEGIPVTAETITDMKAIFGTLKRST